MSQSRRKYIYRSRAEWSRLLAEYEAGDTTQRDFCAERGLSYSNFWRRRLPTEALDDGPGWSADRVADAVRVVCRTRRLAGGAGAGQRCRSSPEIAWHVLSRIPGTGVAVRPAHRYAEVVRRPVGTGEEHPPGGSPQWSSVRVHQPEADPHQGAVL